MKFKNRYFIATLILILVSTNIGFAQESTTSPVLSNGQPVPVSDNAKKDPGKSRKLAADERANDERDRKIIAQSTYLPFKTVKDNFGKKFAKSYFVIQVDIKNEKLDQQFIVQSVDVLIDPNQCENGPALYPRFSVLECRQIFEDYFVFPNAQQGVRREEVLAVGKADLNRSHRNVGFRLLTFSAAMGTILTGFEGVLGPDGVKGVNVLGTTVSAAANQLFPDTADEKLENLRNALPTEDVIIKSKESKTFNIFIPTERVFWSESWKRYIRSPQESDLDTYKLKAVLDLLLLSSATGVLVDNNAPTVTVTSADKAEAQVERFKLDEVPEEFVVTARSANVVLAELEDKLLKGGETKKQAEGSLRTIVTSLSGDKELQTFVENEKWLTDSSNGREIIVGLKKLRREALKAGKDDLVNKINETILKAGQ